MTTRTFWAKHELNTETQFHRIEGYERDSVAAELNLLKMELVQFWLDSQPAFIPHRIVVRPNGFRMQWDDGLLYIFSNATQATFCQVSVEWRDSTGAIISNLYGPAEMRLYNNTLRLKYAYDQKITTREKLKNDYEITHLEVIDQHHKLARLLADDTDCTNTEFWHAWLSGFENERNVYEWKRMAEYE